MFKSLSQLIPNLKDRVFLRELLINYLLRTDGPHLGIEVKYRNSVNFKDSWTVSQVEKYIILSKEDVGKEENILMCP